VRVTRRREKGCHPLWGESDLAGQSRGSGCARPGAIGFQAFGLIPCTLVQVDGFLSAGRSHADLEFASTRTVGCGSFVIPDDDHIRPLEAEKYINRYLVRGGAEQTEMKCLSIVVAIACGAVVGCDRPDRAQSRVSAPANSEPTSKEVIDELIKQKLLRVDISFFQVRSSPEFKDNVNVHWSDSQIGCSLDLNNFSDKNLRLEREQFTDYYLIEIVRTSDGKQASSLPAHPPPGEHPSEYFDLPAGSSKTFGVNYEAFECFHCMRTDGSVRYLFPGDFVIYHKRFPNDRLEFSVDEQGIVRPKFDMKIQDRIDTKSGQGGASKPAKQGE
jgi:hypothetical protein